MTHLPPPHGGLTEPVDRTRDDLGRFDRNIPLSEADLSTLYRIGDGALSPLIGPMTRAEYHQVLDEEVIVRNGKKYAWTIPIAFPVDLATARTLRAGDTVGLTDPKGETVGSLEVHDVYPWEKLKYLRVVYQTERVDHPGAAMTLRDDRTFLVGGPVWVRPQPKHPEYGHLVLTPRETRRLFTERGYERVVAFQTRNALHRAHEYALVVGLEQLTRAGFYAAAVLNPLIGETKSDDVDALTRMRTYRALIENGVLGQGDIDEELWRSVGRRFQDHVLLLGLDIKMFYAGPKEAIMHAIYRQNFGFTHLIIGRKHADAPYDDGTDIWDGLAAQRKFDDLKGDLLIQPLKVGFAAFFEELGRVGLVDEYAPKGYKTVSISGRELREQLRAGRLPDPRIMRPETARVLIERMRSA